MLDAVIALLRRTLRRHANLPVFGICLGCQLLALAAGAETYKVESPARAPRRPSAC